MDTGVVSLSLLCASWASEKSWNPYQNFIPGMIFSSKKYSNENVGLHVYEYSFYVQSYTMK